MFSITFNELNKAIDEGFLGIEFATPNEAFLNELRHSNAVFSAFKTHRQQNDIAANLLDADGKLKPFAQFDKDVKGLIEKYNKDWLKTEYNTAVIRARQAANYKKFEEDQDLFPNLKWLPSTSVEKRELHVPFYNLVKPINDQFWIDNYPGSLWNCKCGITNTDDEPSTKVPIRNYDLVPGLDKNPGITGELFTDTHPYAENGYLPKKKLKKIANKKADDTMTNDK